MDNAAPAQTTAHASDERYEFDQDTRVTRSASQRQGGVNFVVHFTDRWNIGAVCNGGYVNAVVGKCCKEAMLGAHKDMLTCTTHYVGPTRPGPGNVHVEVLKRGRNNSTVRATLEQKGRICVTVLAALGSMEQIAKYEGKRVLAPCKLPAFHPLEQCQEYSGPVALDRRVQKWISSVRTEEGEGVEILGWIRFRDGRPVDLQSLSMFVDSVTPLLLVAGLADRNTWFPTTELTWHCRGIPTGHLLKYRAVTRHVHNGVGELDIEWWDERSALVALSRQYFSMVAWEKNQAAKSKL